MWSGGREITKRPSRTKYESMFFTLGLSIGLWKQIKYGTFHSLNSLNQAEFRESWGRGERRIEPEGSTAPQENGPHHQLTRVHRDSLSGSPYGWPRSSEYTLFNCVAWYSCGAPNSDQGLSDSFACFWNLFPSTWLPHLALIWGDMTSLKAT